MRRLMVIATTILLVGFGAASPAFAEQSPDPGTPACDLLVAADVDVARTTTALTIARSDVSSTPEEIAAAEQAREDAVADATLALCLGTVDPDPTTEPTTEPTPDPTTEPTPSTPAGPTVDEKVAAPLGRLSDALNTKVAALGFCTGGEPTSTPDPIVTVNPTVVVRPTDDDGSVATGSQVREVPEGSVATGGR